MSAPRLAERLALLLALAVLLGASVACSSRRFVYRSPPAVVLQEGVDADGARVRYELRPGQASAPRIVETTTRTLDRAFLGIETKDITAELATVLGVTAWKGVYIDRIVPGSAAETGGLLRGDILRALGPTEVTARQQVSEIIESQLAPGEPVRVTVQRWATGEEDVRLLTREVEVVPAARPVEQTRTRVHEMPHAKSVQRRTGLQVAEVPGELCEPVFGEPGPVVLVCGVVTGSPGYRAGFRGGDRVRSVDGEPVTGLEDVERAVVQRVVDKGWSPTRGELKGRGEWLDGPAPRGRLELGVDGPLGPLERRVSLWKDVDDDVDFTFPILFSYESDAADTEWSFLDFLIVWGASYESSYLGSGTRDNDAHTELKLLPFGMFCYRSTPDWTEWTFFWFISFRV